MLELPNESGKAKGTKMNFRIELVTVNANAEVLNKTNDTVDGAGFVRIVDSMVGIHGKAVSTSEFIADTGLETVMTIWFPVNEDGGYQTGIRVFNQTPAFMRQVYADFRKETCGRCGGTGIYGAVYGVDGRPSGGIGQCFRCHGHGKVTHFQNELGHMGMSLYGSGFTMSYEEFCRMYRRENGAPELTYCERCSVIPVAPGLKFCADCSEAEVAEFEAEAAADAPDFVIDDGTYTLVYDGDTYFTFRIRTAKTGKFAGKRLAEYLNGPDNSLDFQAFGFVNTHTINVWRRFENGHLVNRAREIEAVARNDREALESAGLLYAERSSRCRRCNKVLTVPASLAAGYGPDCAARIGIAYGASSDAPNGAYAGVRVEGSEIVSDTPMTFTEMWDALTPEDRKLALREINAGFQESMNEVNGTVGLVY